MKLAVLLLGLVIGVPAAAADTTIHPPGGPVVIVDATSQHAAPAPGKRRMRTRLLEAFDDNRDGRLDRRERRRAVRAVRKLSRRLDRFDRDGDGNLGPGELPPRMQKKLRRFDRNGDGWVSPDERPQRRR